MSLDDVLLFAPVAARAYGQRVAARLGIELAAHEERVFEDGEHKTRPLESARGRDVYVLQALHGDDDQGVNEKLLRLLFFLATLRDAHAERVTAVIPYLAYARKDRRTKPWDPVLTRYLAQLFEAVGVDRIVALDVHNPAAFENAFRIPVVHLEARPLFVRELLREAPGNKLVIVSPDAGGYKRAQRLRETLGEHSGVVPGMAFLEKKRSEDGLSGDALVGEMVGRAAVIVDDLVGTGATLARAAVACRGAGAQSIRAVVTHGLFTGDASRILAEAPLDQLIVADSVPPFRLDPALRRRRLRVLDSAPLIAESIRRLHEDASIVEMLEEFAG